MLLRSVCALLLLAPLPSFAQSPAKPKYPGLPSETPASVRPDHATASTTCGAT